MTARSLPADAMEVKEGEHGIVRVFATDREDVVTRHGIGTMIGAVVNAEKIEVIDTRDVAALGLSTYLSEGYGIEAADLADGAEALNAIDGRVALIPSSAFTVRPATLSPSPPLRYIGVFAEAAGAPPQPMARRSAGEGTVPPPVEDAAESGRSARRPSWPLFLIALLIGAALVLFAVL